MRARLLLFFLVLALPAGAEDGALERRVQSLAQELRCLVCQNQTLADSSAPLAVDLRNQIREQLAAGKSERDVVDFMVARYGDFVLYRPPFKWTTVLLWAGPFIFLLAGFYILIRYVSRRRIGEPALSPESPQSALRQLVKKGVCGGNLVSPVLQSGWRESNPRSQLGRLELYH